MVISFSYAILLTIAMPVALRKCKALISKALKEAVENEAIKNPFILKGWHYRFGTITAHAV